MASITGRVGCGFGTLGPGAGIVGTVGSVGTVGTTCFLEMFTLTIARFETESRAVKIMLLEPGITGTADAFQRAVPPTDCMAARPVTP